MAELLAPAGERDAGYAALEYGADAVYLGLDRFSARAEAVNFTPDALAEFVEYAHSLTPRRRVYCTLNTLVQDRELPDAGLTLFDAARCGVDAIIVQDAGVAALVRERFPTLSLHASTQMAIHNLDGALAAKRLGFRRVTLARELTLSEVGGIVQGVGPGMEVETFIHGTLCYSYSGLCLFSSMTTGRSGNRGRCVYSCREAAACGGRGETAHPFSLKDMALGTRVLDLVNAGVASLKIEGRKKSPLYVAATVDYYRKILDGKLEPGEAEEYEARLKTIFARPWTKLFIDSPKNPEAADPQVVGHRGSAIGTVKSLVRTPAGPGILFAPSMPVERHDGLQIDVPGQARPFGFPVSHLYRVSQSSFASVFAAKAGETLAAALPDDAPPLSSGLSLYLSSSQSVKRSYPFSKPKPGLFAPKYNIAVAVTITPQEGGVTLPVTVRCTAVMSLPLSWRVDGAETSVVSADVCARLDAFPARDAAGAEKAAQTAFSRLGESRFALDEWRFENPGCVFIRPGEWNRLRRELLESIQRQLEEREASVRRALSASIAPVERAPRRVPCDDKPEWGVAVDSIRDMAAFTAGDFEGLGEVVVGVSHNHALVNQNELMTLARTIGNEKIRLALPVIMRGEEAERIREHVDLLFEAGFTRWLVPGWAGWLWLAGKKDVDMAADWSLYVFNRRAANALLEHGFSACTLSPEDSRGNMQSLLSDYGERAWVVAYLDVPLFISAACAHAHLGLCSPKKNGAMPCPAGNHPLEIHMERSGGAIIIPDGCGSIVLGAKPFSLAGKIPALVKSGARRFRMDLRWKPRSPEATAQLWRSAKNRVLPEGGIGNIERGVV